MAFVVATVGDKVRCIDPNTGIIMDGIYQVIEVVKPEDGRQSIYYLKGLDRGYYAKRFTVELDIVLTGTTSSIAINNHTFPTCQNNMSLRQSIMKLSPQPVWHLLLYLLALLVHTFTLIPVLFILALFPSMLFAGLALFNIAMSVWWILRIKRWYYSTHKSHFLPMQTSSPRLRVPMTPEEQIQIEADQEAEEFFAELDADHAHKEIK